MRTFLLLVTLSAIISGCTKQSDNQVIDSTTTTITSSNSSNQYTQPQPPPQTPPLPPMPTPPSPRPDTLASPDSTLPH